MTLPFEARQCGRINARPALQRRAAPMPARLSAPVLTASLAAMLAACAPQSPEDARAAAIAKCERQFARQAPDPAKGTALCGCLTDRLAEEGLAITDMVGSERARVEAIARSCASSAGVSLPTP